MTASLVRLTGINSALALKAPVRCATTGPITLSGLQTIDGVTFQQSDVAFPNSGTNKRVLVKNQIDQTQNGIYDVNVAAWTRSADFDGNDDAVQGTRVQVAQGTYNQGLWVLTTADPVYITNSGNGVSNITFVPQSLILAGIGTISSVANVSVVLATPGNINTVITTRAYANEGDLGGGTFVWSANNHATDVTNDPQHGIFVPPPGDPTGASGSWVRQYSGPYNVRWFGAQGDGSTDDTSAIQAAINTIRGTSETTPISAANYLFFPTGVYLISSPISLYSGVVLTGEGQGSLIKAGGFSGTALVLLKGQQSNTYCQFSGYRDMGFQCTGSVWAVLASAVNILNCNFLNGWLNCGFGLNLNTYTQNCVINGLFSFGSIDQVLHLKGNQNFIFNVDKEGGTGSSTDPYILIENHSSNSQQNTLDGILLEGTCSANKTPLKLLNCNETHLNNIWLEPSASDGNGIRLVGCLNTHMRGVEGLLSTLKLNVNTSQSTRIDALNMDAEDNAPSAWLTIDSVSDLTIGTLYQRRYQDIALLSYFASNVRVENVYSASVYTSGDVSNGYSPIQRVEYLPSQNWLQNGSFEAGRYAWAFGGSNPDVTEEYITSVVAQGLMGHFVFSGAQNQSLFQNITVPAGVPITFSFLCKCVAGTGSGFIYASMNGSGISGSASYDRANQGTGWQMLSQTVVPTSAGALGISIGFVNVTEFYVDECSVSAGKLGVTYQHRFGTFEMNGSTFVSTVSNAPPSTGTWKRGDVCFNAVPASGQPKGWRCTVAGSPGTWVSEGNL